MSVRRQFLCFLLAVFCCCVVGAFEQAPSRHWQEAKTISGNFKAVSALPDLEIFSAPNIVMIKVNKTTEVRIFTILGKLISSQRLEPGIFEYKLDAHGIYIIKTEDSSCKVAL